MRLRSTHIVRQIAVTTVIAMVPMAIMLIAMTHLLDPKPKAVALDYSLTTAMQQSGTTVGIADSNLYGMSDADIVATLNEMQSLGVNTVRVMVPWGGVQPLDPTDPLLGGYRDWNKVDFIVNQAVSRNMAVLGVLNATPSWGGQNGTGCWGCPGVAPDPTKFAAFAAEAATRYAGKISAYEVWNEPNYFASWLPAPDPVAYTNVLRAVYTAIKGDPNNPNDGADPNALVVGGVLGSVASFGNVTYDTVDFVRQMYANGAKGYFDALSYHPYNYTTKFSDGTYDPFWAPWNKWSPLNQLLEIRQLMIDNQDQALRIWASEFGLPTGGPNGVSEQDQAAFISDFLNKWASMADAYGSYTGPAFIYTTRDVVGAETTEDGSFGIFKFDATLNAWVVKAAAQVIKDFIAAHPADPTDPTDPADPPSLSEQLAQALAAFFQQIQAVIQGVVNSFNSFVNAVAQAIAAIFNPGGAGVTAVPTSLQDEVAEGTSIAAMSVRSNATVVDRSSSDASVSADTDAADTESAVVNEVTASEETPTATTDAESSEASTSDPATTASKTVDTEKPSGDSENSDSADTKTITPATAAETDTSRDDLGDVTNTESREPARTGLVARPTKLDSDGTAGTDDSISKGDKTSGAKSGTTGDSGSSAGSSSESDSGGSDSGGSDSGGTN